ncbi:hypothetical protein K1719_000286 [Acacia pycnantha]|nr:hypothetical protein K1719_000286 [Acacia pycnantha]
MAASTAPSSSLCNRLHSLYVTPSSFSITLKFPPTPISHKPPNLNLKSHSLTPSPLSLYHLHLDSAAFDAFEGDQDSANAEQVQEPKAEHSENSEQEEDDQKVSDSNEAGRIYAGNLSFSMSERVRYR